MIKKYENKDMTGSFRFTPPYTKSAPLNLCPFFNVYICLHSISLFLEMLSYSRDLYRGITYILKLYSSPLQGWAIIYLTMVYEWI